SGAPGRQPGVSPARRMGWGLAAQGNDEILKLLLPDVKGEAARRKAAFEHLSKCLARASQFIKAISVDAGDAPDDVSLNLVCGHGIKTTRRAEADLKTGGVKVTEFGSGDGKILTTSAIRDRRAEDGFKGHYMSSPIPWHSIMLFRAAHMGITKAQGFEDNLLFRLIMEEGCKRRKT
ncbi:MAG: hypothetical protein JW808_07900, partial [Victivallales bacterium]|nr:hypothetical protein [Victivallales bacterium]